ncbi:rCG60426 [Rattus norvegicus]|uniref:RCG60426 n=1 Tax=Rattus norvegicus TaxID=10116 RepID=A6KK59_RAT|nr:rCG60426 [Rattus norvegicus]
MKDNYYICVQWQKINKK